MFKIFKYGKLEKVLMLKYKNASENEAVLDAEDFKNGFLAPQGYENLKQQCLYMQFNKEIAIKMPAKYEKNFKNTLEAMTANELSHIKKDRTQTKAIAIALLIAGLICFLLIHLIETLRGDIIKEIIIIASWVFIWASVEKWFFDRRRLNLQKLSLLQILTAKIIATDENPPQDM